MQQLPPDVLREIARRVRNMRNRMALEATSRTMRAAVRPMTAEITRETRAGLCRALKIAFGIRKVMHQFVDTVPSRVDSTKQIAFKKAIEAFISEAKARAQPGEGAELTSRVIMDFYDTSCHITSLFGGYVNGSRIDIEATIRPEFVNFYFLSRGWRGIKASQAVSVSKAGVTSSARRHRHSAAKLKKEIRRVMASHRGRRVLRAAEHPVLVAARRAAHEVRLKELKMRLQQANYDQPETIAIKVAMRAIKACATSLHAAMW